MTEAGCTIQAFQIDVAELLQPPDELLGRELLGHLEDVHKAIDATLAAKDAYKASLNQLVESMLSQPAAVANLETRGDFSLKAIVENLRDTGDEEAQQLIDRLEAAHG